MSYDTQSHASSLLGRRMPSKELTYNDGSSNKFWKIEITGDSHTVHFGKVGTAGQTRTKEFDSDEDALKSYDKLIAQKLKKGYTESGGSSKATKKTSKKATKKSTKKTTKTTKAKSNPAGSAKTKTAPKKKASAPQESAPDFDLSVTHDLGLSESELCLLYTSDAADE